MIYAAAAPRPIYASPYALRAFPSKTASSASPSSPIPVRQSRYSCISNAHAADSAAGSMLEQCTAAGEVEVGGSVHARNMGQSGGSDGVRGPAKGRRLE